MKRKKLINYNFYFKIMLDLQREVRFAIRSKHIE